MNLYKMIPPEIPRPLPSEVDYISSELREELQVALQLLEDLEKAQGKEDRARIVQGLRERLEIVEPEDHRFLREFEELIAHAEAILSRLPAEAWGMEPEGDFGPYEYFVHLPQSALLVFAAIYEQYGLSLPEEATHLSKVLQRVKDQVGGAKAASGEEGKTKSQELAFLPLAGARKQFHILKEKIRVTPYTFHEKFWQPQISLLKKLFDGIPQELYGQLITHPVSERIEPVLEALRRICITHFVNHLAQVNKGLRQLGTQPARSLFREPEAPVVE